MLLNGYFSLLYKMLEKHLGHSFLFYLLIEMLQFVHEISSFQEVLFKGGVLKSFSKFIAKHKNWSSGGVLSKDVHKSFAKFTEKHLYNKIAGWKPETVRSSHWGCSVKNGVLKNFKNSQISLENTCTEVLV